MRRPVGQAHVRVDPRLRFLLPPRLRGDEPVAADLDGTATVVHVLEALGIPRTEVGVVSVNDAAVPPNHRLAPGDEVAVTPVARPQRTLPQGYLLDVHLGTLARRMRLLGLDTAYERHADDVVLFERAVGEGRVLLTRDRGLLRRRDLPAGALVRGDDPDAQLADVLDRFAPELRPWTRCPACNGPLAAVAVTEVADLLEVGTLQTSTEFARCTACGRPYWRGAHAARLEAIVARAQDSVERWSPSGGARSNGGTG